MKRISSVWKKLVKRVSSKSTSDDSSSSPSSRSSASTGTSRALSGKGIGGRKSTGGAQDAKVLQILSDFSKNRNLAEGAGGQQNTMLFLLQREMDFYNADVERRRQKMLEEAQTCVAAVVGRKKASSVRKTDDALPYVPKRIDWSEIAKVAAKKAAAAPPPAKKSQAAAPTREKSVKDKAAAPAVAPLTPIAAETATPQPPKASEPSTQAASLPEKHVEPAPSAPAPSAPAAAQPQTTSSEPHSESSSSSESSTTETAGQLTNVIAQIVQDAQNPERAKQHEELRQTSIDDMIKMSRNEPDTFDRIISENTKDSLFVTQPTHDEWRAWQGSGGGEIRAKNWTDEIDLAGAQVSSKTFCCSTTCHKPRHPNYPYAKKPP